MRISLSSIPCISDTCLGPRQLGRAPPRRANPPWVDFYNALRMPSFYYKLLLFAAVLLLTRWGLRALQRRLGVAMQYYLLVGTTGLLALVLFNMPLAFLDRIPMLGFTLNSWHVVLWYASLWYSFGALFRISFIPRLLSLPCFFGCC